MTTLFACSREAALTARELGRMKHLTNPVNILEKEGFCELQDGHSGPHAWYVQSSSEGTWWLLWSWAGREITNKPDCTAQSGIQNAVDSDACTLPGGHPGVHSFELRAFF